MKLLKASLPVISIFCAALLVRIIYNVIVAGDYFPFEQYPRRLPSKIMLDMINLMSFPIFFSAVAGLLVTWSHWKKSAGCLSALGLHNYAEHSLLR